MYEGASDWRGPGDGCGMRAMSKQPDRGKLLQLWDGMYTARNDGQMSPVAKKSEWWCGLKVVA
jgi:hypothetical protein